MDISVIIRTKDSATTIRTCLQYLKSQSVQPKEIIIVDSGSTDATLDIVNQFETTVIFYPTNIAFNYSKAINIGMQKISGTYALIISSHTYLVDRRSIEWMLSLLKSCHHFKSVSMSSVRVQDIVTHTKKFTDIVWQVVTKKNFQGRAMFNSCALLRRADWSQQHFSEDIPTGEDQFWIHQYMVNENAAAAVIYHPKAINANPYQSTKKLVREYVTIARSVYPYHLSMRHLLNMVVSSFLTIVFRKAKRKKAWTRIKIAGGVIVHKLFPKHITSNYR